MNEQHVGRMRPDMDVCDRDGRKIGTLARVYRDEFANAMVAAGVAPGEVVGTRPSRPGILEVKTGPLGLGEHLYIPIDAIRDVSEAGVFLAQRKHELAAEWHREPDFLDQLR
jgi:hypothetical protein